MTNTPFQALQIELRLHIKQFFVVATLSHQLIMGTVLGDFAVFEQRNMYQKWDTLYLTPKVKF